MLHVSICPRYPVSRPPAVLGHRQSCPTVRRLVVAAVLMVVHASIHLPFAMSDDSQTKESSPCPAAQPEGTDSPAASLLDGPDLKDHATLSETLRAIALTAIPDQYEDLKQWGRKREVFAGVRMEQRGFNVRFSERKRQVNHGMWHRYKIEMIDPARNLKLTIDKVRPTNGNQFEFSVHLGSRLRCRGDFEHWVLGVKGLNFTVVSEADVDVIADCEVVVQTQPRRGSLIPDVVLDPRVRRVQLFLKDIDVRRIGEIRGDIAETVGDMARHDIENLLQDQEPRVLKKINEALTKNRGRLKIPASKLW